MKIVQINATCGAGSTGKICVAVSRILTDKNIENYIFYTLGSSDYPLGIKYSTELQTKLGALSSRILGNYGFNSKKATKGCERKTFKCKRIAKAERVGNGKSC